MSLSIGLGSIARKDASPLRRYLFEKLREVNWAARLASVLHGRRGFRALVSWALILQPIVRLLSARVKIQRQDRRALVFNYSNERRVLEGLGGDACGVVCYEWSIPGVLHGSAWLALRLLRPRKALQAIRISRRLLRKRGLLVGARQAELLLLYAYFHDRLARLGISGKDFASSTESNPEVISVVLAARRLGNRTTFVNHGFLDKDLGIFFHDTFVLDREALLKRIEAGLPAASAPAIQWRRSGVETKPLRLPDFNRVRHIGIVGSLAMSRENCLRIIRECLAEFPEARISVRPHPNRACTGAFYDCLPKDSRVQFMSPEKDLLKSAESWDFAIAGATSAHLELLQAGIPSVYMDIDGIERDNHGFVDSGILPEATYVRQIGHVVPGTYGSPVWPAQFARFCGTPS